jgi:gas vesicle protein
MFQKRFPWGEVAAAFAIGALAGAATALLLAPMTGRKLQRQIKDKFEDGVDNVERLMKKVRG